MEQKKEKRKEQKIDGLILDVDGTLWDSTPVVARAWNEAFASHGISGERVSPERLKKLFGKTMAAIAQELFPEETPDRQMELMDQSCYYEHEALYAAQEDMCYPGVRDSIKELSRRVKLFIVSNCQKGYIELFLEKTGLGDYITDTECFGNTGREKGENIVLVAQRNHLTFPAYVGDIQGDCDASDKAGVPFIHAAYGFGEVDHCYASIREFSELLRLVKEQEHV